jgi:hypothetical protein
MLFMRETGAEGSEARDNPETVPYHSSDSPPSVRASAQATIWSHACVSARGGFVVHRTSAPRPSNQGSQMDEPTCLSETTRSKAGGLLK